jgi:hypothetical protein
MLLQKIGGTMSAETKTRPQEVTIKSVMRSTYVLSMALNTFVTAGIVAIVMWFVVTNVISDVRQSFISDIHAAQVSKVQK